MYPTHNAMFFIGKVFELCLAEIEKRSPAGGQPEVPAGKCVIM
jgi:hypothetical protein